MEEALLCHPSERMRMKTSAREEAFERGSTFDGCCLIPTIFMSMGFPFFVRAPLPLPIVGVMQPLPFFDTALAGHFRSIFAIPPSDGFIDSVASSRLSSPSFSSTVQRLSRHLLGIASLLFLGLPLVPRWMLLYGGWGGIRPGDHQPRFSSTPEPSLPSPGSEFQGMVARAADFHFLLRTSAWYVRFFTYKSFFAK